MGLLVGCLGNVFLLNSWGGTSKAAGIIDMSIFLCLVWVSEIEEAESGLWAWAGRFSLSTVENAGKLTTGEVCLSLCSLLILLLLLELEWGDIAMVFVDGFMPRNFLYSLRVKVERLGAGGADTAGAAGTSGI